MWCVSSDTLADSPVCHLLGSSHIRLEVISLGFVFICLKKAKCLLLEIIVLQTTHSQKLGAYMYVQLRRTKELINRVGELFKLKFAKGVACPTEKVGFGSSDERIESGV